ncbi:MAG: type II secretion system F family protein [Pseudomonadota bacterium]
MDPRIVQIAGLVAAVAGILVALVGWRRGRSRSAVGEAPSEPVVISGDAASRPAAWRALLAPIANAFRPTNQADFAVLAGRLQQAGRRGRDEIDRFLEEKALLLLVGLAIGLALTTMLDGTTGLLALVACLAGGVMGADIQINSKIAQRKLALARGLPSAIDLLVTCLDAGLPLDDAITRVGKELVLSYPAMSEELCTTASEADAGVPLADALRRLAQRAGLDDLSALCAVIAQGYALGAPIAQTLREYAVSSRAQRLAALEERAGKTATKMMLPVALCLLPAALLLVLGPAFIQIGKAFH